MTSTGSSASLEWVRIFFHSLAHRLIKPAGHCGGGVGAHMIGQTGAETTTLDPQNNVLMRMVEWVENGNAPETVTGTKYINVTLLVSELL